MNEKIISCGLAEALVAEGFPLPNECREARVIASAGNALMIQYDVFLTDDDVIRLGKALQRLGEGVQELRLKAGM